MTATPTPSTITCPECEWSSSDSYTVEVINDLTGTCPNCGAEFVTCEVCELTPHECGKLGACEPTGRRCDVCAVDILSGDPNGHDACTPHDHRPVEGFAVQVTHKGETFDKTYLDGVNNYQYALRIATRVRSELPAATVTVEPVLGCGCRGSQFPTPDDWDIDTLRLFTDRLTTLDGPYSWHASNMGHGLERPTINLTPVGSDRHSLVWSDDSAALFVIDLDDPDSEWLHSFDIEDIATLVNTTYLLTGLYARCQRPAPEGGAPESMRTTR